jgi:outer membrane protein
MKKLFKVALVAMCIMFVGNFAKAQTKIGYINFGEVIRELPEAKTVQTQLDAYQKQFVDELSEMNNAFQAEQKKYQAGFNTMTDAQKTAEQGQLQDMQKRMQDFQTDAQQKVEAKSNELIKPLSDKAKAAVNEVAKEKGYSYVFDTSQGAPLLVSPDGDDLLPAVKVKLALK